MVAWATEQSDTSSIAVHLDTRDAEQRRVWQHLQARALGVPLAPLAALSAAGNDADASEPAIRSRVLSLSEAFYLLTTTPQWVAAPPSFGSHAQIYERFCCASGSALRFQRQLVTQFHFRELGWVLKSGLNYGGHFVLYRGAASEFHSEYVVYVRESAQEQLPWSVVQALTRVAADVKKTILVCDVACEELIPNGSATTSNSTTCAETTLTCGEYAFYGQRFCFSAIAIRFWDATGADSLQPAAAAATAAAEPSHPLSFAFQPQPVLKKKPRKKLHMGKRARGTGK